jgi:PHP family Zn ribbon phosphoesterase
MTPGNIIKEALKLGLDCIAITDHNAAGNVEPALKIARNTDLIVIPGMELESVEEVHLLCYFPGLAEIKEWELTVQANLPLLYNDEEVFGYQLLTDESDDYIGKEERLLATATGLSISQVVEGVSSLGGIVIPAHVDKAVNSIIGQLGFLPPELDSCIIEISRNTAPLNFFKKYPGLKNLPYLRSSDSHYLYEIGSCGEQYKGFYLEKPLF